MRFLTNLTLVKKVSLITAVGLLLGISVFSVLSIRAVNKAIESMLDDRLTTAYLIGNYIDEALDNAMTELEGTAGNIAAADSPAIVHAEIEALARVYDRMSISTLDIYLVDAAGRVSWSRSGADVNLRASIPHTDGISGLAAAPVSQAPVIFLACRISENAGGDARLVVAMDVAQSRIGGFVQPIQLGDSGYVEIVDKSGIVVTRTQPGNTLTPFERSDHSGRFADLIADDRPTQGVCHTCHEQGQNIQRRDVLAFVPLSEADWGVVVRQSEDEALAPARELRSNLLLFGISLVGVTLALVVVTTRDIGSRIMQLNTASRQIAEGDLESPVPSCGRDEIGILAGSLDGMRTRLRTSYGELEQRTEELSSLLSIAEIMTSTLSLPELLDAMLARTVAVMPGADAGVLFRNADDGQPVVQSAVGLDRAELEDFITASVGDAAAPDQGDILTAYLSRRGSAVNPQNVARAQITLDQKPAGLIIVFSFSPGPVFVDSSQHLIKVVAEDIALAVARERLTREAEAAQALYQADRLRSEIISTVSHELRTPLTFIKAYADSLLRPDAKLDAATRDEFLGKINGKTDELRELIDKLLLSAKIEAGAQKINREPLLIPRLAKTAVEEVQARGEKHDFKVSFPAAFPVIEGDARAVEQVLRNLIENAVKYSPEGGPIEVSGRVDGDAVVVTVSDRGIGIPRRDQERVFERFYRVENKTVRGTSGSGLGLSIARGHVMAHGGIIRLESTPGQGSRFSFSLPLEKNRDEGADDT